jgi:spore maturation protein SpmA
VIGTGVLVKSVIILGGIGYVGGPAMANGAADVAANVIGTGSAATMHGLKQTGHELKAAQADETKTDKKGN